MATNWDNALALRDAYVTMKQHFDLIVFHTRRSGIDRIMVDKITVGYEIDGMNHGIVAHKVMSHADKGREILVLENGVIKRSYSRVTNSGLLRLANLNDDEWMKFSHGISSVSNLTAHNFTQHVRRTWPIRD